MSEQLLPIGSSPVNSWMVNADSVSFVRARPKPRPVAIDAQPQRITLDKSRAALIVVDMQNDFCHPDGWLASIGVDVSPNRKPIEPIRDMVGLARSTDMPVIWLNWGNRPDRRNLGPSTHHVYDPDGRSTGLGAPLPGNGAPVLELGSWAAAIVDEFGDTSDDVHVAKYAMCGFWDTTLDAILRNLGIDTLLFAGVNLDQCVLCTLQSASFRGYDCVLVEDCCGTTSPDYCEEATLYNIKQCFGFVSNSRIITQAVGLQA